MTVKPGTFVSLGDIGQAMGRFEAEVLVKFHDPELSIVSQKAPPKSPFAGWDRAAGARVYRFWGFSGKNIGGPVDRAASALIMRRSGLG